MDTISKISFLERVKIFSELNQNQLYSLSKLIDHEQFEKHDYVYEPNDSASKIYFLIKGTIKIGRYSKSNKEVIRSILRENTMFGEHSLFGEVHREDFALVIEPKTVCLTIDTSKFQSFLGSNSQLALRFIMSLGRKLRMAERRYESLVVEDARTRIVDFLKYNANEFGRKVGLEMLIKHSLTQQDIANYTGTSRQTVTSVLNELKRTNQIHFKRKSILIRDINTLA